MIKLVIASVLVAGLGGGDVSARAPVPSKPLWEPIARPVQSSEECIRHAFDLAQSAEAKIIAEDKLDQIEDLLARMEALCDAKQWDEAMAVAEDIQKVIEGE